MDEKNLDKLKTLTTEHLLNLLQYGKYDGVVFHEIVEGGVFRDWIFSNEEIKSVLADRPHIPNKHERRGLLKKQKPKQKRKLKYSQRKGILE